MKSLLVELGVEELPSRFVDSAAGQLMDRLKAGLEGARLHFLESRGFGTPRRVAALFRGIPEEQAATQRMVRGPARRVAFAEDGTPTRAAAGFARSQGVPVDELVVRTVPEGEYVFAVRLEPPHASVEVLPEIVSQAVRQISFPRSMRWLPGGITFSRPIRWLVVLFGDEVVPVSIDGLTSGRESRGHRLSHPGPVVIESADGYEEAMAAAGVVADGRRRRAMVVQEVEAAAARSGGVALGSATLIDEITNLVEYPVAMTGRFDPAYLELPREVLTTTMAAHQRYVAVGDGQGGLMPLFVVVANGSHVKEAVVREGNERVLAARLADARFFFDEDRKQGLADRVKALSGLSFHPRLGSMQEKVQRLVILAGHLAERCGVSPDEAERARQAAQLSKADLLTRMVTEFPELQGIMGGEYARRSGGVHPQVAEAIAEQYMPRGAGDDLPRSVEGALLSTADKLDTVVGFFGVNEIPSGSEDPFALRRHATGVVRITLNRAWHWSLREAIAKAASLYGDKLEEGREDLSRSVADFIVQRLRSLLAEEGLPADVVEAAAGEGIDDLTAAAARARAIAGLRGGAAFQDVLVAFQRAHNLARGRMGDGTVDAALLREPSERRLFDAVEQASGRVEAALAGGRYEEAVNVLSGLRGPVDRFFDEVLVMADDERIRTNRLQLLSRMVRIFNRVCDFAALAS